MKRLVAAIFALLLMVSCAVAEKQPLPEIFRFTQETQPGRMCARMCTFSARTL